MARARGIPYPSKSGSRKPGTQSSCQSAPCKTHRNSMIPTGKGKAYAREYETLQFAWRDESTRQIQGSVKGWGARQRILASNWMGSIWAEYALRVEMKWIKLLAARNVVPSRRWVFAPSANPRNTCAAHFKSRITMYLLGALWVYVEVNSINNVCAES